MLKIPVVSTCISTVFGMGFVKEIKTITEYKKVLTNINYDYSFFKLQNYENLIMFLYFYFIKNQIPW
jgi:hypothetical protein